MGISVTPEGGFKKATQPPLEPPRLTGEPQTDLASLREWIWSFYLQTVIQSGLLDPIYQQVEGLISFDVLPDPQATTIARAQATANAAWTAGEQFKVDLDFNLRQWIFGGTFTISGGATSASPVFANDIGTTDYRATATPTGSTGVVSNDAFRVVQQTKGTGGIAFSVAGAPGVGASVTYDYIVVAILPDLSELDDEEA